MVQSEVRKVSAEDFDRFSVQLFDSFEKAVTAIAGQNQRDLGYEMRVERGEDEITLYLTEEKYFYLKRYPSSRKLFFSSPWSAGAMYRLDADEKRWVLSMDDFSKDDLMFGFALFSFNVFHFFSQRNHHKGLVSRVRGVSRYRVEGVSYKV